VGGGGGGGLISQNDASGHYKVLVPVVRLSCIRLSNGKGSHKNYIRNFNHELSNFIISSKIIIYTVNSFMANLKML